jgi:HK97 family phage prohead protease
MTDLSLRDVKETERRWRPAFATDWSVRTNAGSSATLEGYASITDKPYKMRDPFGEYDETIRSGAFSKTLAEGASVNFLANHAGLSLAHTKNGTLRLSPDTTGLHSEADLDLRRSDASDLFLAVERGDVREMSFAFRVVKQSWSPDYDERTITEVNMDKGDSSAVNFGANPATTITAQRAMTKLREGRALDAEDVNMLTQALGWLTAIDMIADAGQDALADYLGVPSPDCEDPMDPADMGDMSAMAAQSALDLRRRTRQRRLAALSL